MGFDDEDQALFLKIKELMIKSKKEDKQYLVDIGCGRIINIFEYKTTK